MDLAERLGGVVVNADSMQVYRDLRVLSARPTLADEARVPHRLYGHVDAGENYSVARYIRDLGTALDEIEREGLLPVIVGGTGLYFKAMTEGLSEIPAVPDAVREATRAEAQCMATGDLHRLLAQRDPQAAEMLLPSDRLRVMRALEVFAATGRSITSFRDAREPGPLAGRPIARIFLSPDREKVRATIDGRFLRMMEEGGLDEVAVLKARRLDPMLPAMRAHGVPWLLRHLDGELSREEAVMRAQGDTRRYAKRQFTWFRHQLAGWPWVDPADALENVLLQLCSDI